MRERNTTLARPEAERPTHAAPERSFQAVVTPEAVTAASEWAKHLAEELRLRNEDAYRVDLVLTEIVQNVVDHADVDEGAAPLEVHARVDDAGLRLTVVDAGREFDPLSVERPQQPDSIETAPLGGLGIVLVREFANECRYERQGDRNRFEVFFALEPEKP